MRGMVGGVTFFALLYWSALFTTPDTDWEYVVLELELINGNRQCRSFEVRTNREPIFIDYHWRSGYTLNYRYPDEFWGLSGTTEHLQTGVVGFTEASICPSNTF